MSWNIGEARYPQVATFWEIKEDHDIWAVVSISTSRKDKEKEWHNSNWSFCRFVGNAYKGLHDLEKKDRIVIKAGVIAQEAYDSDGEKKYPKNPQITIFAWEKYEAPEGSGGSKMDTPPVVEDDEELPF